MEAQAMPAPPPSSKPAAPLYSRHEAIANVAGDSMSHHSADPTARGPQAVKAPDTMKENLAPLAGVNMYQKATFGDFIAKHQIGRGRNTAVYTATCRRTGRRVAIKAYMKAGLTALDRHRIKREIDILRLLRHEHVIHYYGHFDDSENIYIVQEWASGGDLFEELKNSGNSMSEKRIVTQILWPLIKALQHMHSRGVVHRDIKPENLLISASRKLKVCDFGLAINVRDEVPASRLGTLQYMSPEVVSRGGRIPAHPSLEQRARSLASEPYNEMVDIWACGVLVYELVMGKPPFEGRNDEQTTFRILYSEIQRDELPPVMSLQCRDFIEKVLRKSPSERLTLEQMSRHALITTHITPTSAPVPDLVPYLACPSTFALTPNIQARAEGSTATECQSPLSPLSPSPTAESSSDACLPHQRPAPAPPQLSQAGPGMAGAQPGPTSGPAGTSDAAVPARTAARTHNLGAPQVLFDADMVNAKASAALLPAGQQWAPPAGAGEAATEEAKQVGKEQQPLMKGPSGGLVVISDGDSANVAPGGDPAASSLTMPWLKAFAQLFSPEHASDLQQRPSPGKVQAAQGQNHLPQKMADTTTGTRSAPEHAAEQQPHEPPAKTSAAHAPIAQQQLAVATPPSLAKGQQTSPQQEQPALNKGGRLPLSVRVKGSIGRSPLGDPEKMAEAQSGRRITPPARTWHLLGGGTRSGTVYPGSPRCVGNPRDMLR